MTQHDQHIAAWRDAFRDETTGIHRTIQDLLWNYAAFRTTVRIVQLAGEKTDTRPPLNQMMFNLVSQGYWSSLLLGTRRLLDKAPINGPKGVYSIRSVVRDVKESQRWLNRRIYVEKVRGAQYDLDRLRQEEYNCVAAANKPAMWIGTESMVSEAAHHHFDILSGVSPIERNPSDLISDAIFKKIESRLSNLDRITDYTSSHVAHAGNRQSRQDRELGDFDIREAEKTLRQLKEIADLVGVWCANQGGAGLSTYLGDQFDGLDHPVVDTADLAELPKQWRLIDREIAEWSIGPEDL